LEEDPSVSSDQRLVGSISAMKEDLCLLELKNECRVVRASAEELLGHERYLEVLEKSAPGRVLFKSEKVSFSDL
jgi:hypothetical protein